MTTRVRIGVTLPEFTGERARFVDGARRAEDIGLDSIWLFDHLWPLSGGKERPILEMWTSLSYLASFTSSIRIGTLVTRSSLRRPALLAKMAATVGDIAPGRLTVGIGSGDFLSRDENEAYGLEYFAGDRRFAQYASTVEVLRKYLHAPEVHHSDEFVKITGLPTSPSSTSPPIWVAGRSAAMLEIAGRLGDGWNGWVTRPEQWARGAATVRAAAAGRAVELTWAGLVVLDRTDAAAQAKLGARDPREYIVGGPVTVGRRLLEFVDAGATHLVLTLIDPAKKGIYELLADRVRAEMGVA